MNPRFPIIRRVKLTTIETRGLGDVVALGAKPVARVLDRIFGTRFFDCGKCEERQTKLNDLVPFK